MHALGPNGSTVKGTDFIDIENTPLNLDEWTDQLEPVDDIDLTTLSKQELDEAAPENYQRVEAPFVSSLDTLKAMVDTKRDGAFIQQITHVDLIPISEEGQLLYPAPSMHMTHGFRLRVTRHNIKQDITIDIPTSEIGRQQKKVFYSPIANRSDEAFGVSVLCFSAPEPPCRSMQLVFAKYKKDPTSKKMQLSAIAPMLYSRVAMKTKIERAVLHPDTPSSITQKLIDRRSSFSDFRSSVTVAYGVQIEKIELPLSETETYVAFIDAGNAQKVLKTNLKYTRQIKRDQQPATGESSLQGSQSGQQGLTAPQALTSTNHSAPGQLGGPAHRNTTNGNRPSQNNSHSNGDIAKNNTVATDDTDDIDEEDEPDFAGPPESLKNDNTKGTKGAAFLFKKNFQAKNSKDTIEVSPVGLAEDWSVDFINALFTPEGLDNNSSRSEVLFLQQVVDKNAPESSETLQIRMVPEGQEFSITSNASQNGSDEIDDIPDSLYNGGMSPSSQPPLAENESEVQSGDNSDINISTDNSGNSKDQLLTIEIRPRAEDNPNLVQDVFSEDAIARLFIPASYISKKNREYVFYESQKNNIYNLNFTDPENPLPRTKEHIRNLLSLRKVPEVQAYIKRHIGEKSNYSFCADHNKKGREIFVYNKYFCALGDPRGKNCAQYDQDRWIGHDGFSNRRKYSLKFLNSIAGVAPYIEDIAKTIDVPPTFLNIIYPENKNYFLDEYAISPVSAGKSNESSAGPFQITSQTARLQVRSLLSQKLLPRQENDSLGIYSNIRRSLQERRSQVNYGRRPDDRDHRYYFWNSSLLASNYVKEILDGKALNRPEYLYSLYRNGSNFNILDCSQSLSDSECAAQQTKAFHILSQCFADKRDRSSDTTCFAQLEANFKYLNTKNLRKTFPSNLFVSKHSTALRNVILQNQGQQNNKCYVTEGTLDYIALSIISLIPDHPEINIEIEPDLTLLDRGLKLYRPNSNNPFL